MKFIAIRSFRNPDRRIKIENPLHPDHIEIGTIFEIGSAPSLAELTKEDRHLVMLLSMARCLGDPDNAETIAAVDRLKGETARREARQLADYNRQGAKR